MAPTSGQNFFFVNKHASSLNLSRSESTEQSRILSHVRGQDQRKSSKSQPWKLFTDVIDPTEKELSDKLQRQHHRHRERGDLMHRRTTRDRSGSQPFVDRRRPALFDHDNTVQASLFGRQPSYNSLDPFHCTAGSINATESLHLVGSPFGMDVSRITWGAESLEPPLKLANKPSSRHDAARIKRMKECVDNELLLCSSIAHGSSVRAWIKGESGDARSRFWVGRTLQTLRVELTNPETIASQALVLSIFTLALASLWNAVPRMWFQDPYVEETHIVACRVHVQAMLEVVRIAGAWDKFGPYILEGMILVDKYAALQSMTPPLIPLTFDPGSRGLDFRPTGVQTEDGISDVATGFQDLEIDQALVETLLDSSQFCHMAAGPWRVEADLTPQQENLLYLRFQALHYKLLLFEPEPDDWTSRLLKLTGLLVLCNVTLYTGGLVSAHWVVQRLRVVMEEILPQKGVVHEEIWLWCLCTGASTRLPVVCRTWFIDQLRLQVLQMGLSPEVSVLQDILRKYLYLPWLQDQQLKSAISH